MDCALCQLAPPDTAGAVNVCSQCEEEFARDDAFAQKFFRERKFNSPNPPITETFEGREFTYLTFDPSCFYELRKFILGTLVRFELGWQNQGKSLLGPLTEMLFSAYLDPTIYLESFPILLNRDGPSENRAEEVFSGRIWKLKTQSFFYLDYRILVFCDGRHVYPTMLEKLILRPETVRAVVE